MTIKEKLPGLQENVLLAGYTTFKIGGPARYFFVAKNKKDLIRAAKSAGNFKIPFFILGGGSNVLINDKGFNGLVIKNEAKKFQIKGSKIIAESGTILAKVIKSSINKGLSGLVEGSGIPGTVGGAVYGNAGWPAGKWAIGDLVKEVELLMPNGRIKKVNKKWLSFNYRESRLKKMKNGKTILNVIFQLKRGKLKDLKNKQRKILEERLQKIPPGFSAGSVFKNPPGKSAGFLIEKCGLKGKRTGDAKISEKHANFILNLGKAKAEEVRELIKLAKQEVKKKFRIILEEETQYLF